ncbi:MAG: NADH-quinone oxidoreductase subunit C [Candidatus Odinarchaeota archaeon]
MTELTQLPKTEELKNEYEIVEELKTLLGSDLLEYKVPRVNRVWITVPNGKHYKVAEYLYNKMGVWFISTVTGLDLKDHFEVLFHFLDMQRKVEITVRVPVSKDKPELESLTDFYPGANLYEREVYDMFGIVFKGHPNLKRLLLAETFPKGEHPLRKDWTPDKWDPKKVKLIQRKPITPETSDDYVLQVGPQTPTLKEPMNFEVILDGEIVVDIIPHIEYNHRGLEKAFEQRTFIQGIYLAERVCGICSQAHTLPYCDAVEQLLGVQVPPRGKYIRTMVAEFNRIHSHLLWIGVACHLIGWDTMFMYSWRDREVILDLTDLVCGSRVTAAINTIGGVRRDVTDDEIHKIRKGMDILEKRTKTYKKIVFEEDTLLKRAVGVGYLNPSYLKAMCDIAGRLLVRVDELIESVNMIRYILDHLPSGEVRTKVPRRVPAGEAVSHNEAPRGEVFYYIKSNGTDKPERVKIITPTMANLLPIIESCKGHYLADFVLNFGSIDPCIACMCRTTFTDISKKQPKQWVWTDEQMRQYSIEWYQNKGWRK